MNIRTIGQMTDDEGEFYGVTLEGDIAAVKTVARLYGEKVSVVPADLLEEAVKALEALRKSALLLQQNAEGCAVNHYGEDFSIHGMPGWLSDTAADIEFARATLAKIKGE